MSGERIAIVGAAALFPKAEGLDRYWANVRDGVDCIGDVPATHWSPEEHYDPDPGAPDRTYARRGGFLPAVRLRPLELGVPPAALEATDSAQLLGLETARRALADAGYGPGGRPFDRDRASVVLGVTGTLQLVIPLGARLGHPIWRKALREAGVGGERAEDVVRRIADGYVPWKEDSFPGLLGNVVAGRIANRLDLRGTNCVVDAACASSLSAIHLAVLELASGRSDLVVSGGVDTFNDVFMYLCFSKTPALSPTGDARPFDASADGTVLGEGVGLLVLRRLADAERDGDRVLAVIRGVGSSSDGKGEAIYAPTVAGQARALRAAYGEAGVSPATVELVEAHGTGTRVGDAVELRALTEVFREARPEGTWCALGSVKGQVGHTKAAAGAAGILKAALALHRKVLPPTIKVARPLPPLADGSTPFRLEAAKRPWLPSPGHPRRAGVSAFGFGGSNFHCVLEEHGARREAPDWDGDAVLLPFAGDSREEVAAAAAAFPRDLPWPEFRARAAAARRAFDGGRPCRLVAAVERGRTDLGRLLDGAAALLGKAEARVPWSTPDGAHYGEGAAPGRLGVLFPGQGSQYAGMLRDLACAFPEMLDVLEEADRVFASGGGEGPRLSDRVYPPTAWDEAGREAVEEALRATRVAQPAIGAVSLGALRVLEGFGVVPDAVAGHSYGELLALCAAGRFDGEALHRLSGLRGRLMAGGRADAGAMLAVQAAPDVVEGVLRERGLDLVVANRNAPEQAVVSGATGEIERAGAAFEGLDIRAKRLPVAAAFHSPLVAHAREPMREALRAVEIRPPRIPVYANSTADAYPEDPEAAREVLAGQLAMPVEFVRIVENMHAAGVRTFLEVGPGARLSSLVGAILGDRPHEAFALDASSGRRSGMADLAAALARLAALGFPADLRRWDPDAPEVREDEGRPGFTVEVCGANLKKAPSPPVPGVGSRGLESAGQVTPPAPDARSAVPGDALDALVKIQQTTASVHRLFLEGQDRIREALVAAMEGRAVGPLPALAPAPPLPEPPAAPVEAPAAPVPAAPAGAAPETASALLAAVSEKTGYPVEMLDLDMGMDADLGIDSIKRVEILSALQERIPGLPPVKPERLGSFRTLREIVEFLGGSEEEGGSGEGARRAEAERGGDRDGQGEESPSERGAARDGQGEDLASVLLQAVAERTGYPVEMLDAGMSLDADLGIDSIKRVEILSAVQERVPGLPAVKPDLLGKFRTLREIADHLSSAAAPAPAPAPAAAPPPAPPPAITRLLVRAVPWAPPAAREPVGVRPGAEVLVAGGGDGLASAVAEALRARGLAARTVPAGLPGEVPAVLGGLVLVAPPGAGDGAVGDAFAAASRAAAALRRGAGERAAFLATVSRMDGAFGLGGAAAPEPAALAGLLKAAAREWPGVACRAFDVDPAVDPSAAADAVAAEALLRGPAETGIGPAGMVALEDFPAPLPEGDGALPLREGEVVVVSGGARGVTAACALALAGAARPTLVLLGRSPLPGEEPADLRGIADEAGLKRALLARSGGRASPREIEAAFREAAAAREVRATLAAAEAAGARALYLPVDVRDAAALREAVEGVRRAHGPVAGIVHGAGVLADGLLEGKAAADLDRVYGTKVAGLRNLLAAAGEDDLRLLVLFSSVSARRGRAGQSDYAAANEVLNRAARAEARRRPRCRVLALGWGPWEGGMVTPALARAFAAEGTALLPPGAGAAWFLREIAAARPGEAVEAVVLAGEAPRPVPPPAAPSPLARAFDLVADAARHRYLRSHVLDGRPVVPATILVEWLAHGALHGNPGMVFHGMEEFRVLKGVVLEGGAPVPVRVLAGRGEERGGLRAVPVELRGTAGNRDGVHARATVLLAAALPPAPAAAPVPEVPPYPDGPEAIYADLLFHGPDFRGLAAVEGVGPGGAVVRAKAAPPPREWLEQPLRSSWVADPLALDAAFQGAILWTVARRGAPSLPTGFARLLQWRRAWPREGVRASVVPVRDREHEAVFDIEIADGAGGLVARVEGYASVVDPSLRDAFRRREPR